MTRKTSGGVLEDVKIDLVGRHPHIVKAIGTGLKGTFLRENVDKDLRFRKKARSRDGIEVEVTRLRIRFSEHLREQGAEEIAAHRIERAVQDYARKGEERPPEYERANVDYRIRFAKRIGREKVETWGWQKLDLIAPRHYSP